MRLILGLVLLSALLVALAACASGVQPASQTTAPVKVRVGYLAGDLHHVARIVAGDPAVGGGRSLYEQYGLTVEDAQGSPYANGGVEMDHFAAGHVDLGLVGSPPAIIKHLNAGVDTIIVGQVNQIGSALVVAKNINRFADLAGKTVATPGRSTIQFFLLLNLAEKEGLDLGRLTVIDLAPKDMRAKLETGDIAGYVAWEPFASDAALSGTGKILATSQDIWPDHLCSVVVADRKFAEKNPEVVRKFLQAHRAATQWINDALARPDSQEYSLLVDLGVKFTGRDAAVIKESFKGIRYRADIDAAFQDSFVQYTNKLIQFKIVPQEKLQERGHSSAADFAATYIQKAFQER